MRFAISLGSLIVTLALLGAGTHSPQLPTPAVLHVALRISDAAAPGAARGLAPPPPQLSASGPRSLHPIDESARRSAVKQTTSSDGGAPLTITGDAQRSAAIETALDEARRAFGVPGVALAVARSDGTSWSVGTGVELAAQGGEQVDGATPFAIGSATKTFVAALVLELVEEGQIGLDDRLGQHLPEADRFGDVTIGQLLGHTSGIADFYLPMRELLLAQPGRRWSADELLATVDAPWFTPGAGWSYSNTNYILLGKLVTEVTGRPIAEELQARFFSPLGLDTVALDEGRAVGGSELLIPGWGSAFWTSGAMTSGTTDLARWAAQLYGGRVLRESTRARMVDLSDHGYGLGTQRLALAGREGIGHTGLLGHYTTLLIWIAEERVAIAICANRSEAPLDALVSWRPNGGPSVMELILQPPN